MSRRPTPAAMLRLLRASAGLLVLAGLAAGPAAEAAPAGPGVAQGGSGGPAGPAAGAPAQEAGIGYRLADTWQGRRWALTAGRYGETADISSAPDGSTFVLDARYGVVHVLAPDRSPLRVFPVDEGGRWTPRRLDAGADGGFLLLSDGPRTGDAFLSRVARYDALGNQRMAVELQNLTPNAYRDIAAHLDGRIYLSRAGPQNPYVAFPGPTATPMPPGSPPLNAIEVLDADGGLLARFGSEHLCLPDSLDLAADGTVYVVNHCPSPFSSGSPGPTPTPRPSLARGPTGRPADSRPAPARLAAPRQAPEAASEGILVFRPDHQLDRKERFNNVDDLAVGPAGVFLSRNVEIFALGDRDPLYSSPAGRFYTSFFGEVVFHLDVPAAGGLAASMNHCLFQGVVDFQRPAERPAVGRLRGALDQPELEGPAYPLRVAAGEGLAVLEGSFTRSGDNPPQYLLLPYYNENQVVQRWGFDGTLPSQLGLCTSSAGGPMRDLAMDGADVYVVDQSILQRRPDDQLPAWNYWPGLDDEPGVTVRLAAVSAAAGKVAALDVGAGRVVVLDRDMGLVGRWPLAGAGANALPVDLALGADRVYVADNGRGRVQVWGLDGTRLGEWPLHEGATGIALGPTGDVFVLGRGGWGYRYRPDGRLLAAWPMPDQDLEALDISVGPDGRVYVPFLERAVVGDSQSFRGADLVQLRQAGLWVFEAVSLPPPPPPPPAEACVGVPDKRAAPARIPLGDRVTVKLEVGGRCPGRSQPAQVALVFDTSRSMNFDDVILDARDGALDLLAAMDAVNTEVALLTFDDAAAMRQPLTHDLAGVGARLAALQGGGDTRMSAGIDAARLELTGPRGKPAARRVMVLVTDGIPKDDPLPAAAAARAAGIDVYVLVYSSWEFQSTDLDFMVSVAGDPGSVLVRPLPSRVALMAQDLTSYRPTNGLFEAITIRDVVPDNMRYVPGSARPPATLEGNTLVWTFQDVLAVDGLGMAYELQPLEVGTWPTNVEARAAYRDALGFDGALVFPIPEVTVWTVDRRHSVYLPYLSKGQCLRPERPLDVVLALDASSSMNEPEPGGGSKLEAALAAAAGFLDLLRLPGDHAGLVTFNHEAERRAELTGDRAALAAALAGVGTALGTRIDLGLAAAGALLAEGARPEARQVVVLLTDGIQSQGSPDDARAAAAALKAGGALVYTIGLGANVQPELLRDLASSPDRYFPSPSAADLAEIYRQISERLACEGEGAPTAVGAARGPGAPTR